MAMAAVYTTVKGLIFSETRGGTETVYVPDTLGSLIECRDASGAKTYSAEYWPYGEVQTSTGTNPSSWGFVGLLGYLKDLTDLLYVRARHYRPKLARWLVVDPLFPMLRAYNYVAGDPVRWPDPSGLAPLSSSSKPSPMSCPDGYMLAGESYVSFLSKSAIHSIRCWKKAEWKECLQIWKPSCLQFTRYFFGESDWAWIHNFVAGGVVACLMAPPWFKAICLAVFYLSYLIQSCKRKSGDYCLLERVNCSLIVPIPSYSCC